MYHSTQFPKTNPQSSLFGSAISDDECTIYHSSTYCEAQNLLLQASTPSQSNETSLYTRPKPVKANPDTKAALFDCQPQMHHTDRYYMGGSAGTNITNIKSSHDDNYLGISQTRYHQRTPSTSTVASTGPVSPYMQSASFPRIASSDQAPNSPSYFLESHYGKNLPALFDTPREGAFGSTAFVPASATHMSNAHLAMKGFGIDYHTSEDFATDFAPSRQSMSSYGNDSPATPQSGVGDGDASKTFNTSATGEFGKRNRCDLVGCSHSRVIGNPNPNVQLFRTESEAFRDELYNPDAIYNTANLKPASNVNTANTYLTPHRNLITERLQTANLARSTSPSGLSRQRSPFRDNSPMAPDWKQVGPVTTAASIRQHQADDSVQAEFGRHRAPLRREPTKTISPKDALLDYTADADQAPLFQDSIPAGYKQHVGSTESWPSNFISQPNANFGNLAAAGQQNLSFRNAASGDIGYSGTHFDFPSLPQSNEDSQVNPFQANYQAAPTPNFPASIPSMETSISDAGPPMSSQESMSNTTSVPRRPDDTRANTGAYTCTYHGCTQRFESHAVLQKHKRDFHRSQQSHQQDVESSPPSNMGSASPRSTESPGPSGAGMTSAAILARNSQAGPHKCTRINPSTNKPCNTIFSRPYDLTRHEDTIHNGRKQKVSCPLCREQKTFSRNDALTRHMRVVHPEATETHKRSKRGE